MNKKEIESQYKQISLLLKNNRLLEAMVQLDAILQDSKLYRLSAKLDEVRTSYRYMLQYMSQGVADENRAHLFGQLKDMLKMLLEQTHLWQLDQVGNSYYHIQRKLMSGKSSAWLEEQIRVLTDFSDELAVCQLMPSQNQQQILQKHEQAARNLFISTWCNSGWTVEEQAQYQRFFESETIQPNDQCLIVSALTLSLMQCVDAMKLSLLAEICRHKDARIAQRALVGVALVAIVSPKQVALHADALIPLSTIFDNRIAGRLNTVYIQLLRAQNTDKVDKKMREEIIPEMIKNANQLNIFEHKSDENDDELNPDWQKQPDAKFEDKIREMGELQQAGADVYLTTFSQLKSYPFFHELPNWFLPFDHAHSSVVSIFGLDGKGENNLLTLLLHSGMFCNSDKYSLCFTMNMMPKEGREQLFSQLTDQGADMLEDEQRLKGLKNYIEQPEVISNTYIHDLYRFFKLHPRRAEFKDPFAQKIALHSLPFFRDLLETSEYQRQLADTLFQLEKYAEASEVYDFLLLGFNGEEKSYINADFYRRYAYCNQKMEAYLSALDTYKHADLIQPGHIWTLRQMAICCRMSEDYEQAIGYYRQIEEIEPENIQLMLQIAACYANMAEYKIALEYLIKADYLDADNPKILRALAWCNFLKGNYERASEYCARVLQMQADASDYLNAGHVAWVMGKVSEATGHYRQAAQLCNQRQEFIEMFNKDIRLLEERGITTTDMALMKELTLNF